MTDAAAGERHELESIVGPGETVLWTGRPSAMALMAKARWVFYLVIAAAVISPIVLWLLLGDLRANAPNIFYLLIVLVVVADLVPVGFLTLTMHLQTRRLVYALTDQRALVILRGKKDLARSFGPDEIAGRQVQRRSRTAGDILFTQPDAQGDAIGWIGLRDVDEAERHLAKVARR